MVRAGGNVDAFPGSLILPFAGFLYTNSHSLHSTTTAPVARIDGQLMTHSPLELTYPVVSLPVSVLTHTRTKVRGRQALAETHVISTHPQP